MQLRRLEDLDLKNKKVLVRLDLNVPIKNGKITDDTRIKAALPTIRYIAEHAKAFALCSHLGRPKGAPDPQYSLEPVGVRLAELLHKEVVFVEDYVSEPLEQVTNQLDANQFILLENLRFYPGETANDRNFAEHLMNGFDLYVNDGFGAVHRAHASVCAAAELVSPDCRAAGFLIEKEVEALSPLLKNPKGPFTVIMGGAKVSDKIAVIYSLLNSCNNLLIGGAMAYTFLKYRGVEVGSSKVELDKLDLVDSIYRNAEQRKVRIEIPLDHICATEFSEHAAPLLVPEQTIPAAYMGLDIGPRTSELYERIIKSSGTVLWNGPMGVFEWDQFAKGSEAVAKAMAECQGTTIVGGGDSVAAVNKVGSADKMTHISTGGGASLELLEGKILPGLRVLYQ
jgi:phosphoglycerate kinase